MDLMWLIAFIGWAVLQFIGLFLAFLTAHIESKYVYYLKKGVK